MSAALWFLEVTVAWGEWRVIPQALVFGGQW